MTAVSALSLAVADYLLTFALLKGTLLILAIAGLAVALRRASAAARAGVWTIGAATLFLLPAAAAAYPLWELAFIGFPDVLWHTSGLDLAGHVAGEADAAAMPVALAWAGSLPLAVWLAWIWLAGVLLVLGRLAVQRAALHRLARSGLPARDARTHTLLAQLGPVLGLRRPIRLVYSADVSTALTFGWLRPVVILPAAARRWSRDKLRAVLCHELGHIARTDYAALLLIELASALYWINPLVWRLRHHARREQELASDDLVLGCGVAPGEYARYMVDVARGMRHREPAAVLPFARRSTVSRRLAALLERPERSGPAERRTLLLPFAAAALLAVSLGGGELWHCEYDDVPVASAVPAEIAPQAPAGD